jgi:hypothetical protein
MRKSDLFIATLSLTAVFNYPSGVFARTIQECNTIYNNCTANCDRYAPSPGAAANCIVNCGAKAQRCHNTASDRPGRRPSTLSRFGRSGQDPVRTPRLK